MEGRSARQPETRPVGTSGRTPAPRRPTHTQIGGKPQGSNSIFIEIDGVRWYKAGPAEAIDEPAQGGRHAEADEHRAADVALRAQEAPVAAKPLRRGSGDEHPCPVAHDREREQPASWPVVKFERARQQSAQERHDHAVGRLERGGGERC